MDSSAVVKVGLVAGAGYLAYQWYQQQAAAPSSTSSSTPPGTTSSGAGVNTTPVTPVTVQPSSYSGPSLDQMYSTPGCRPRGNERWGQCGNVSWDVGIPGNGSCGSGPGNAKRGACRFLSHSGQISRHACCGAGYREPSGVCGFNACKLLHSDGHSRCLELVPRQSDPSGDIECS